MPFFCSTTGSITDIEELREGARNAAAADIFSYMTSEEKSNELLTQIRSLPDTALDLMAKKEGMPEDQFHIHRAMVRGEDNIFIDELKKVDGLLQTGDIILMTGTSNSSQNLVAAQKLLYEKARSSHIAVVHADFVCVDSMPELDVSNRIISEVLSNVENDWRVIRCKKLQTKDLDAITRACVFYLAQPYKILPSKKSMKKFSYCSELARKVYSHSGISGIGIPNNHIIKPADFDRLADEKHLQWQDVTEAVRPAINFCSKYPELVKITAALFIQGLKLNKKRFEERTSQLAAIKLGAKAGKTSAKRAKEMIKILKDIENNLHHTFWDVHRKG